MLIGFCLSVVVLAGNAGGIDEVHQCMVEESARLGRDLHYQTPQELEKALRKWHKLEEDSGFKHYPMLRI